MAERTIFTASFSGVAVTAAQDLFELTAPTGYRLELIDVRFGQDTDEGDAAAELLAVSITRGNSVGSGGAAVAPANVNSEGRPALATVARNNTTQGTGGVVLIADVHNVMAPYLYRPGEEERITAKPGERITVGIVIPADSLTMRGTITWAEIGQLR